MNYVQFPQQKTAIPLEVAARFQINLLIEPIQAISIYEKVQRKFMPILWFEQHVKMSKDIASEVKMILTFPSIGVAMGFVTILIGVLQVAFIPVKNFVSHRCCSQLKKINHLDKNGNTDTDRPPEISPLITEKSENGISLLGGGDKNVLRS